ncbi:DUF1801 domain-containing protein [Shewanella sp. SNU WT4]|uniref:DUF1801 domain-containing protein n=1 Tax=Shewanella sp. SNU WT4 TaxID=2590015 RepID=UPI001129725B|nr:DUF1801 domain-containing protein [Shewanella sp. SNU WT4]QDF68260.1 DUF1801 domain-containing protein [Shewanella sp. SNU WT4]
MTNTHLLTASWDHYPSAAKAYLLALTQLIYEVASEQQFGEVAASLKWGQVSFTVKGGSSVRLDWTINAPEQVALYFICHTRLVDTFKQLYGEQLILQGNRAIILPLTQPIPINILRHSIKLTFSYQRIKHLPLLGC